MIVPTFTASTFFYLVLHTFVIDVNITNNYFYRSPPPQNILFKCSSLYTSGDVFGVFYVF